ncbi:MAG TPA: spore germination protein GerW family protein [Methanoregulaceae archaeon]|nr:spore germination protein GerW family protein [Methanoregulaceae archaeon]
MSSESMLKSTAEELRESLEAEHVMGKPVDLGDKLVIPVTRFGFGFGAGGGGEGKESGQGSGGGAGIEPVALIILYKDLKGPEGIQVMSLRKESNLVQVINALSDKVAPQIIEAIREMNKKKDQKAE